MNSRLLSPLYPPLARRVNGGLGAVVPALLAAASLQAPPWPAAVQLECDPALTRLFTPARPQLGRYDVCVTPAALETLVGPAWKTTSRPPLDAFGAAGPYDRARLARLYGGRSATVAHGFVERDGRFESITLISPHPDATLSRLLPGTLVIRFDVDGPSAR